MSERWCNPGYVCVMERVCALLNMKTAFRSGDRQELRRVQHHLRDHLRVCKDKRKLEPQHEKGVVCNEGDHRMWGERQTDGHRERAHHLNTFFNRFSSQTTPVSTLPPTSASQLSAVSQHPYNSSSGTPPAWVLFPKVFSIWPK